MSADITIVHSSEFDNPSILPKAGWYVCALRGQECEGADGPYTTFETACQAMCAGVWINPALEWYGSEMRPTIGSRA